MLDKIMSLFTGGVVDTIRDTVDDFHLSGEEKAELNLRLQKVISDRAAAASEQLMARFNMVLQVIKSDNASGDNFTKRARPSVVYTGLAVIIWNYAMMPTLVFIGSLFSSAEVPPVWTPIDMPTAFWAAWGGICATWSVGRSMEKSAAHKGQEANGIAQLIGGSGNSKIDDAMRQAFE